MNRREFCWTMAALGATAKAQASILSAETGALAASAPPSFPAGKLPAIHTLLSLLREDRGDEILPSLWSDNAVTLLPGETKQFAVTCRDGLLASAEPHLMIEGWNIVPSQSRLSDGKPVDLAVEIVKIQPDYKRGVASIEARPRQSSSKPSRITTCPLLISVNGKPVRTARMGIGGSATKTVVASAVVQLEGIRPADKVTVL